MQRTLRSLLLLATALLGGPGSAGLEAWEHAHRTASGHGHRIHFEQRGGQDHDDTCGAWVRSSPVRTPLPAPTEVRLPPPAAVQCDAVQQVNRPKTTTHLPPSRAPPASV